MKQNFVVSVIILFFVLVFINRILCEDLSSLHDRDKKFGAFNYIKSNESNYEIADTENFINERALGIINLIDTLISIKGSTAVCNLIQTALDIAHTEFEPEHITLLLWRQGDVIEENYFTNKYHGSVVTASVGDTTLHIVHDLFFTNRVTQTIFIASTPPNFEYMAVNIKKYVVIPIRAILIIMDQTCDENAMTIVTKAAWKNDIGDIVILNSNNETNKVKLWTYYPYRIGDCDNYTAVPLDASKGYFPRKFKNFYGCPIRVTLLHFLPYVLLEKDNDTVLSISGIDGQALNLVIEKLNASFDVVCSTEHGGIGTFINGNGTGSFGDLVNGIADIFSPAILITDLRYPRAQFSYVYETLDVYWCGPNQQEIYAWAKVLLPFFSNISPFIVLSFAIFVLATKVIRRYALCKPERKRGIFFMAFVMFLGQEVNFMTKCWLVNSLFVMWIWFCMIVRIGYQGDLVDGLQSKILEPPLNTFEEAVDKLPQYGGVEVFRNYYQDTPIADRYQILSLADIPTYIEEVAEGKRFLLVTDIMLVKWFGKTLQVLKDPVSRAGVCLQMRAGWPAAPEVKDITHNIAATGLIEKILDEYQHEWRLHSATEQAAKEAQPLDMATLGACFYGLLAMLGVCFAIFCSEIICYKYELKGKLKRKFKIK